MHSLSLLPMQLNYKNIDVYYEDHGLGDVVVLIHGFLENTSMWNHLASKVSSSYRVVSIDLLGHGKTGNLGYIHTMQEMAESVLYVLQHLQIKSYVLVGHSMGGYVALVLAKTNSKAVRGLCLMNSTYHSDDSERKMLREKAIEAVRKNYGLVVKTSVTNLFAPESKDLYSDDIDFVINEALKTSVQGYVAAQRGMMNRENHFDFLKDLKSEKLIIIGFKDPVVDAERIILETLETSINCRTLPLGHMSHIENKTENTYIIMQFIENIYA